MTFSELHLKYINIELESLSRARQERYSHETRTEWIRAFLDIGYSAEHVCRMIRKVKLYNQTSYKLKFTDFTDFQNDISGMDSIIPLEQKALPYDADRKQEQYLDEVQRTALLLADVRNNLGISFVDFMIMKGKQNLNSQEFYNYLLENRDKITCDKMGSKSNTLASAIKQNF